RIGGDEFIILLKQISQEDSFRILDGMSTRIVNVLELPFQIDDIHIEISTSIGTALYGEHGDNMNDLIKFADKDMYANKKSKSMSKPQKLVEVS
ncbi:MAG TPA: diguanylate cyclase, partial [Campylobacterales bacterium]|nr:diguanylate cyclase [Campylobacterales bacterium]